jgi:outer membrane lipoprotein-sorting protein
LIAKSYRIVFILFLFLFGSIPLARALPDDQLSKIISGMRDRYGNAKGWKAEYTREAISKAMAMLETAERHDLAKGSLYFKPQHFLRLEQASPQEELLLTDGQTLWWYIPLKKQAYKYSAETFGKELALLSDIFQGLKGIKNDFQITLKTGPETTTYHLVLRPEPPWQEIDHLELIMLKRDFSIKQIDIYNNIGGLTRFLFNRWEEKGPFKKGFFSFSPLPDVKVLEK